MEKAHLHQWIKRVEQQRNSVLVAGDVKSILRDCGALLAEEENCLRQLDLVLLVLVAGDQLDLKRLGCATC